MIDDPESAIGIVLTEQRHPVDRERVQTERGKTISQHRQHGLAPLGAKPARQRHVEAEFFEDVRIPPAIEILALPRRQLRWISSFTIIWCQRGTERIERADA